MKIPIDDLNKDKEWKEEKNSDTDSMKTELKNSETLLIEGNDN